MEEKEVILENLENEEVVEEPKAKKTSKKSKKNVEDIQPVSKKRKGMVVSKCDDYVVVKYNGERIKLDGKYDVKVYQFIEF